MGIDQVCDLQAFLCYECAKGFSLELCVAPWVNDGCCSCVVVDDVGVLSEGVECEGLDVEHGVGAEFMLLGY